MSLGSLQDEVFSAYAARTPASAALYARARNVLVAGTTGNLRTHDPYPVYTREGSGCRIRDIDGNEYVDCFLGNGPMLLGHAPAPIVDAERERIGIGSLLLNYEAVVEAAALVCEVSPCAESIRFVNSGTEACLAAVRIARAYTGKWKVVKFAGSYHGQDDQFLLGVGRSRGHTSAGIPTDATANTLLLEHGNLAAADELLAERDDIACLLLDPVVHSDGPRPIDACYFADLAQLCRDRGVLLVFDEVITGFRLALGGAAEQLGLTPDLVVYAKALANGEKVAAIGGRRELMATVEPVDDPFGDGRLNVFQSGTYNDATAGIVATIAAVKTYRRLASDGRYRELDVASASLARDLRALFAGYGVPSRIAQVGSLLHLGVGEGSTDEDDAAIRESALTSLFSLALVGEGILVPPSARGHLYLSFAHEADDLRAIRDATERVLDKFDWSPAPPQAVLRSADAAR